MREGLPGRMVGESMKEEEVIIKLLNKKSRHAQRTAVPGIALATSGA